MQRTLDDVLHDLPGALDRAGALPDAARLRASLAKAQHGDRPRRPGRRWMIEAAAVAAVLILGAYGLHRLGRPAQTVRPARNTAEANGPRTYAGTRSLLVEGLRAAPIPVYLPSGIRTGQGEASIDATDRITADGYQAVIGYGPKAPLPLNSPKAQFGNAELLMIVIGAGPSGHLGIQNWIPLPKAPPIPNAAQGSIDLGHGIVGTTFVAGAGPSTEEAVRWQEGGWTFWVGPWRTADWGNPANQAAQLAARCAGLRFPAPSGTVVFAGGQDAPSEAVFTIGPNRYAVEALGDRAPQFAAAMTPAR